jgi:hypothetical protein
MRGNALSLTDEQLALVRGAANAVPARWRTRYLAAIADWLLIPFSTVDSLRRGLILTSDVAR